MAKTYNITDLSLADPTSSAWALAWARRFAADVPNAAGAWPDHSLDDAEWSAYLEATALKDSTGTTTYYRPHEAAALAIESNPLWLDRLSIAGVTQTFRSASEAASAIRRAGQWIDILIYNKNGPAPDGDRIIPAW